MKKIIAALLFVAACGGDDTYTWGDVSAELSVDYCTALRTCGYDWTDEDVSLCAEHTAWHLCEDDKSCDREVDEETARAALDACASVLASLEAGSGECVLLAWGYVPDECAVVVNLKPAE